jgi:aminopeptidase N
VKTLSGYRTLSLRQIPYQTLASAFEQDPKSIWKIPMHVATEQEYKSRAGKSLVLDTEELVYEWSQDESKWVLINAGQTGFYRVLYPRDMIDSFINTAHQNQSLFEPRDLVGMIENFFSLAYSGHMDVQDGFKLIAALTADNRKP